MAHSEQQQQQPATQQDDSLQAISSKGKDAVKDIIFGSVAGIIGKVIEYPFDTIKVRLQSQVPGLPLQYTGPLDCFRQSLRQDGIIGLYRGISAPFFGAAVETSSLFFSYNLIQDVLRSTVYDNVTTLPFTALAFCGAGAGAFASLLLTPIELIKCKVQVPAGQRQAGWRPPTILGVIAAVYKHQGLAGFWRGQVGTLIRETGGSAAWFGGYEGMKIVMRNNSPSISSDEDLAIWQKMLAGAAAGVNYNFIFYPADTIKSRMQTEDISLTGQGRPTFWAVAKHTWQHGGVRGLYRGCGITVARSVPSSAVIFTIYETLKMKFP